MFHHRNVTWVHICNNLNLHFWHVWGRGDTKYQILGLSWNVTIMFNLRILSRVLICNNPSAHFRHFALEGGGGYQVQNIRKISQVHFLYNRIKLIMSHNIYRQIMGGFLIYIIWNPPFPQQNVRYVHLPYKWDKLTHTNTQGPGVTF